MILWYGLPLIYYKALAFCSVLYASSLIVLFILFFRTVSLQKTFPTVFTRISEFLLVLSINVHFIKITLNWAMDSSPHHVSLFLSAVPFPLCFFFLLFPFLSYGEVYILFIYWWKLWMGNRTMRDIVQVSETWVLETCLLLSGGWWI